MESARVASDAGYLHCRQCALCLVFPLSIQVEKLSGEGRFSPWDETELDSFCKSHLWIGTCKTPLIESRIKLDLKINPTGGTWL